jgi:hypothetical protein
MNELLAFHFSEEKREIEEKKVFKGREEKKEKTDNKDQKETKETKESKE